MTNLYDELNWLEKLNVRFRPNTEQVFNALLEFTDKFENLSKIERTTFVDLVSDDVAKKLLSLSAFVSEYAMSVKSEKWLRVALVLHIIVDFRKDHRENYRYLILIAYASSTLKVSMKKICDDIMDSASLRAQSGLIDFLSRDKELNQLYKYGIRVSCENEIYKFVPA